MDSTLKETEAKKKFIKSQVESENNVQSLKCMVVK